MDWFLYDRDLRHERGQEVRAQNVQIGHHGDLSKTRHIKQIKSTHVNGKW